MELRRHELLRLTAVGWRCAMAEGDPEAHQCFAHWAANDLPLVVATQTAAGNASIVSLGLPSPTAWRRKRFALRVPLSDVNPGLQAFPLLVECESALRHVSPRFVDLRISLSRLSPGTRVYGSFGWQHLTGLSYVREHYDLDLLLPVADAEQADKVVAVLARWDVETWRLDGELCFNDGSAVAWCEWAAWRAGRVSTILVKRLRGASLETDTGWHATAMPAVVVAAA